MSEAITPLVDGIAEGMILALAASGLALIFGVMRIVNFAHGGFIMLGAFLFYSISNALGRSVSVFVIALVCTALATGLAGGVAEVTIYRRFYSRSPLAGLLATFALLLLFEGLVAQVWGIAPIAVSIANVLSNGSVSIAGVSLPAYELLPIGVGAAVIAVLGGLLNWTRVGRETRAVGQDRYMAELLGIDTRRVFTSTFVIGCVLAGISGALLAPTLSLDQTLGATYVVLAFSVVITGGMGSVMGAIVGGLLLGIVDSYVAYFIPSFGGYSIYAAMILVLLVRPSGLFGRGETVAIT